MADPVSAAARRLAEIRGDYLVDSTCVQYVEDKSSYWGNCLTCRRSEETHDIAYLFAALARAEQTIREPQEKEDLPRVAPSVDCVAPAGSTAERCTGEVTAAERTDVIHHFPRVANMVNKDVERRESRSPDGDGQARTNGSTSVVSREGANQTIAGSEPADSLQPTSSRSLPATRAPETSTEPT